MVIAIGVSVLALDGSEALALGRSRHDAWAERDQPGVSQKIWFLALKMDVQTDLPKIAFDPPKEDPFKFNKALLAKILVWIVFAATVGVVVFVVARTIRARRKSAKNKAQIKEDSDPDLVENLVKIGQNSQKIALAGDYAEAIHQLLLKGLKEFQKRKGLSFPVALTSREILAGLKLGPPAGPALSFLVGLVEATRFGRRAPESVDYEEAKARFDSLLLALKSPGAKTQPASARA
jgi:hypothetical protein